MFVNPRTSGSWTPPNATRMSYFARGDEEEDVGLVDDAEGIDELEDVDMSDARTPLDKTIDRIGMGSYQWTLLSLCGFGWLADNMWIQAIAIVLPRVQQHFLVPDQYVGVLSSSMFGGMMIGAIGWGTCSDLMGRTTAFNATLFLTSVFGILASLANTFVTLCIALFLLGSAVGGSMPTDGTLLLEHMPNGKQYLVTALSVFFSLGSVLSAVVGLIIIPKRSCPLTSEPCDVDTQNLGWKYLMAVLGLITLLMFCARMVFFRLHESPRYLVHAGRHQEAVQSLQLISKFNGSELSLGLEDVRDHHHPSESSDERARNSVPIFDAQEEFLGSTLGNLSSEGSREVLRSTPPDYSSTGGPNVPLNEHLFITPPPTGASVFYPPIEEALAKAVERPRSPPIVPNPERRPWPTREPSRSRSSSVSEIKSSMYRKLPRWLGRPLWAWTDRIAMVLSPEWLRTTLLMWAIWCSMSLAYTMFNVYLPKLLEGRGNSDGGTEPKPLEESLWDVVIYSIGGCPGAILGAYLVDSSLGRRWSLAGSTFVTAFFCVIFVFAQHPWAVRGSTVGISLSATAMWAVLYGWTPEIFGTKVRGTACGIASALSRIGGMIAPMLGGALLMIDSSFPVFASIAIFLIAGICVLLLRDNEGPRRNHHAGTMH